LGISTRHDDGGGVGLREEPLADIADEVMDALGVGLARADGADAAVGGVDSPGFVRREAARGIALSGEVLRLPREPYPETGEPAKPLGKYLGLTMAERIHR
jgi:hypothetical protein